MNAQAAEPAPTPTPVNLANSEFLPADFPAPWACDWGEDRYGLWMAFRYRGVRQCLRWIAPGEFQMGSPTSEAERDNDETQHRVILTQGYWLADTVCTQALWQAVTGNNPSGFKGEDWPVENVSWDDAQRFIARLNELAPDGGFRLPTEAEWEYSCRAGKTTAFWFGDQVSPEQVNYNGDYPYAGGQKGLNRRKTVAVKALPCNGWGLYQMHGNVWEWCQDWFGVHPTETVVDPKGPANGEGRVLRGGGWIRNGRFARSASRFHNDPGLRYDNYGFRLARGQTSRQGEPEARAGSEASRAGQTPGTGGGQARLKDEFIGQARLKDEFISTFISTFTHDLRTPLTSIRAFSEILLANPDMEVEQRSKFLGIIVKESERLTRLINQVLDMAEIDSGRIDWRIEPIDPISTVTHDLRTPLTSIRAFSEILLANPDMEAEQRSKFLGIIVKESERLTRLINQVLDMAKIDSGRIDWRIEPIDLRALIQDAINATSQLFHDKAVVLREDLGEDLSEGPATIAGDHDRLIQAIINLLSNAVKFCPDQDGEVTIRLRPLANRWRIKVIDNGPGIAHDQHKLIFEKFHQVVNAHAGRPRGTGLGLPISQKIVEHHGGRIWVESDPGQGATFIVELPGK